MKNVNQLLKDLYKTDPDLMEYEKELKKILKQMLENEPDIKLDKTFVENLKKQLTLRAEELSEAMPHRTGWMNKVIFALSGAAVTAIAFIAITQSVPVGQEALFTSRIEPVGKTAFDLSQAGDTAVAVTAMPQAEGGPAVYGRGGGGVTGTDDMKMIVMPEVMVNYRFNYSGVLPLPEDGEIGVLKRNLISVSDKRFMDTLKAFDFGLFDIKNFSNLKTDYLSVTEDKKYGYSLQINFNEGIINIGQNWAKWPNPYADCSGDSCQLTEKDMPEDSILIAIADDFLKDYGISFEDYGTPVVLRDWLLYRGPADTMPAYFPDQIRIVYPELIDGKYVTESDGTYTGVYVSVSVSVRDKKVINVNNLRANHYQKSLYQTEPDSDKIIDWARQGGVYFYAYRGAEKTVDVTLETPELVYFRYFKWLPEENKTEEFLIPAYSFPIAENPELNLYRTRIIVPAVKGFEELNDQPEAVPFMAR